MKASMRPLIVGQAPGPGGPGSGGALAGRAGQRLAMLVEVERLALGFDVVNLLPSYPGRASGKGDRFPMREARAAAAMIDLFAPHDRVVLLGRSVCRAFNLRLGPLEATECRGRRWLHVPHPSGVNRWWNDEANVDAAAGALRGIMA